ncbi:uncharacterized protein TNCV_607681 [Trichonephila clavipes]|nr:uncharacterized protein TNCV_607681 [Trichonephila clavipes]
MIVLAWLRKEPMDLKTFVQNRVAKIQEFYPNQLWRHVPSDQNPTDLVSRGVDPDVQQNLWFNGPTFLSVMSFLGKGKKADLIKLAIELGECKSNEEELKIIELRTKILTNDAYKEDPEFVKCIFEGIVSNRIDEENKQKEQTLREFELQKIRLQNETQRVVGPQTLPQTKIELKKLLPTFNPEVDNMDLFLTLFERDVTSLIAREPEEKCRDYSHIRGMLLQRFKLTAEKFRELFSRHRKSPNGTWKDYYFEIRAYFEGWLNELKIDSFDGLKNLMIVDQMKKKCSPECKEHYLDIWEELISPEMLADKLEAFDKIRRSLPSGPRRYVPNERSPLRCYGCGKQGVIKSRCPTCNLNASQRTDVATKHINAYTAQTRSPRLTLIDITFCGIKGRVCADTGSSHSIAGERMFQIFKDKGLLFQETTLAMSLADGQQTIGKALTTQVMVEIEGRSVLTKFIILPKAKGNRTLLGTDFLSSAGLVLDVKNTCWYFRDNPTHKYPFGEELDTPSIVEKMSSNTCQLREGEGGEATNILEHHINTGNSPPISVPPYRMSPVKKEILRKEIEDLLEKDIIEECESPYGAPVVLIPKPNSQFRLCIDYRKLNEVTVSDTYPLPRMDDLLQEAKHTAYISTIDL